MRYASATAERRPRRQSIPKSRGIRRPKGSDMQRASYWFRPTTIAALAAAVPDGERSKFAEDAVLDSLARLAKSGALGPEQLGPIGLALATARAPEATDG